MKGSEIMPSLISDLVALVDIEIPEGQQSLKDSYTNLENVANYCESNYFISTCKKSSLEETKNFATQSLASLAYQVNSLAFNVLHVLDLQTSQLSDMESQINHIFQVVQVHKEKVARREIGILTSTKSSTRAHKILAPANQERPVKYIRKPVDYSILDDIGHGVKSYTSNNTPKRSKRTLAPLHQNPLNGTSAGPAPTTKPPTPPQPIRTGGSLSRSAKEYRTPAPPIPPPQVPSNYAPNYPLMSYPKGLKDLRRSGYSTLPIVTSSPQAPQGMTTATQPPIGMVHPMRESLHSNTLGASSPTPPPSPDLNMGNKLQEPPNSAHFECPGNISPPLPPPPEDDSMYHENYNPPSPPSFLRRVEPEWVPKNYIEKVVALYDYSADKEDELSFSESSVIYVVKKNDDGWYEGVLDGITGLFPGNYVEPCL